MLPSLVIKGTYVEVFLGRIGILAPRIRLFDLLLESLEPILEIPGGLVQVLEVGDLGRDRSVAVLQRIQEAETRKNAKSGPNTNLSILGLTSKV